MKVFNWDIAVVVRDEDVLIQTDDCGKQAIVSDVDGEVFLELLDSSGKKDFVITRGFAKKLGEALLEISK